MKDIRHIFCPNTLGMTCIFPAMSSKLVFNSKLEMVRNKTRALTQQLKFASKARWSISYSSAKFYQSNNMFEADCMFSHNFIG